MKAKIQAASKEDIQKVLPLLREADRQELEAAHGTSVLNRDGYIISLDDTPLAIMGYQPLGHLSNSCVVWFLSTEAVTEHKHRFLRGSKQFLKEVLGDYNTVYTFVDVNYTLAIKWVVWLGFEFSKPLPLGVNGEMFYIARKNF